MVLHASLLQHAGQADNPIGICQILRNLQDVQFLNSNRESVEISYCSTILTRVHALLLLGARTVGLYTVTAAQDHTVNQA